MRDWARTPTFVPALISGILTMAAPFFIMQAGHRIWNRGIQNAQPERCAPAQLRHPHRFGTGLYASAWVLARLEAL
jgi:hypothetical protein